MDTTYWVRWHGLHILGPVLMLMCGFHVGEATTQSAGLAASIDWHMVDKFDIESYASGNQPSPDQLHPQSWRVWLDGCASVDENPISDPLESFTWAIDLPNGVAPIPAGKHCATIFDFPKQGTFRVKLTVTTLHGNTAEATRYITVRNYLIVSMGDSLAAGEGNPDSLQVRSHVPQGTPTYPVRWVDRRCHRSGWSGHARAAAAIQSMFTADHDHSSVTFVSVACSGAGIAEGIVYEYDGQEPPQEQHDKLPSQIERVKELLCPKPEGCAAKDPELRNIDALLINVGANDMGFGKIVRECAVPITHCTFQWLDPNFGTHNPVRVLSCVPDRICSPSLACVDNLDPHGSTTQIQNGGNESICPVFCDVIRNAWHVEPQFDELVPEFCLPFSEEVKLDIENLQHAYNLLADKLQENLWYSQAYITEYSDPTQDDNGELCNGLLFPDAVTEKFTTVGSVLLGLPPDGLISQDEIAWAHSDVISPLNQQVQNAAARHGWTYIGGIASQFSTHGYCADDHWIVRYDESKNIQENSDGTMHPNLLGQFVYRDQISAALISDLNRDLSITMTASGPVRPFDTLRYTITVTNNGPGAVSGVTIADTLPSGVTFLQALNCSESDSTVTCKRDGIFFQGESVEFEILVVPTVAAVGTITNIASVIGNDPDPDTFNNTAMR